jgi:hypothetical protein
MKAFDDFAHMAIVPSNKADAGAAQCKWRSLLWNISSSPHRTGPVTSENQKIIKRKLKFNAN